MPPGMPPGMPDTSVIHIRRIMSPCLLQLPGKMLDAWNCSQLVGSLLQNRPVIFSGTASVPFPGQTSRTQKKSRLLQHQFCAFLVVRREISPNMRIPCWHLAKLCAWQGHVTITATSVTCGGQGNSKHVILCLGRRRTPLQIGL